VTDREEFWREPTVVKWAQHVIDDMVPKLRDSSVCISLYGDHDPGSGEVKYWVELGAMICMDKPILVVVMGDAVLPPKLSKVADKVVRIPEGVSPESSEQLAEAVRSFAGDYD
jgi:hypothetical protein